MCVGCEGPIHTLFLSDPGIQSVQEAPPGGQNCNPSLVTNICKQWMRLHMVAKFSISKWQRLNSLGTRVRCASGNVFLSCDRGDCLVGCLGEANLGGPLGIMSLSLNCRHIIATLRFQLNFQGAFFPGRGRVGGGVGVKGVLREPGQGATASISQPDGEGCERSFK